SSHRAALSSASPGANEISRSSRPRGLRSEATILSIGGVPMRGRSLHISAVLVAAIAATAMLVLGLSSGAVAANPYPHPDCNNVLTAPVVSCHFSGSDVDPDYCGTGREIDFTFDGHFSLANEPQSVGFRNNSSGTTVLTDPLTGATVLIHSAYRFT